jgi:hypothetical protein
MQNPAFPQRISARMKSQSANFGIDPDLGGGYLEQLASTHGKAAHRRTDRTFSNDTPLDLSDAPFVEHHQEKVTYIAYGDVLCRMPGKNHARLERYSPLDETWVWYAPHAAEVSVRGERISEEDAAKMAQRLYDERDSSLFSEENMPSPVVDLTPDLTPIPRLATVSTPAGVDPEDFAEFMRQQAAKHKAKGTAHVCVLPGFDPETMTCSACTG